MSSDYPLVEITGGPNPNLEIKVGGYKLNKVSKVSFEADAHDIVRITTEQIVALQVRVQAKVDQQFRMIVIGTGDESMEVVGSSIKDCLQQLLEKIGDRRLMAKLWELP